MGMACIGCGLALNADGKGRVDIDTDGGLECNGIGDGGTSNTGGNGLRIKVDSAAGNSLGVDSGGVFVPPAFRMETYYATVSGSLADPLFGAGGTSYTSSPASISLTNITAYDKVFMYQGVVYYSGTTSTPFWIELATSEGGGFSVPSAQFIATGSIVSPLMMLPQSIVVPAGTTKTISAKMVAYRGNLTSWRVSITAWGGYA